MPATEQLAARIREALAASKTSQSALARYCGVSRQLVSLWVHPDPALRSRPNDQHLEMIAQRTGTTVEWLEGVTKKNAPALSAAEPPTRYEHSADRRWRDALKESVLKRHPQSAACFNKVLSLPYLDEGWVFDYVDQDVVAQLVGHRSADRGYVREQFWKLSCLRTLDKQLGNERSYLVLLALEPTDPRAALFAKEAQLADIRVVPSPNGAYGGTALVD